jgi:hypothetical protein
MYRKKVAEALKMGGADVLVLYNTQPHSLRAATEAEKRKTPVVLIAADQDDMKGPWEEYTTRVPSHWGNIFLSWRMNLECPYVKKIQWDGGIEPRSVSNRRRWKSDGVLRLVYSGTGAEAGGVKSLIDSIKYLKGENVHLTLTGPNYSKELLTRINHDPRIEYAGLLGEGQLAELFLEVDVLVNPRSPDLAENRYNFPSKILEYLSWEKLVLSTQTDGIAPHYLDGLIKTRGGSPSDIADSITQIYKWDHEKHGMYVAKAVAIKKQYTKRSAIYHLKNFLEGMLELSVR